MGTWKVTVQSARSKASYEVSGSGSRRARSRWELLPSITSPVCPVTPRIRKNEPQSKWQRCQPREEEKPVKSNQRRQAATLSRSSLCGLPIHITSSTPGGHSPRTSSLFLIRVYLRDTHDESGRWEAGGGPDEKPCYVGTSPETQIVPTSVQPSHA